MEARWTRRRIAAAAGALRGGVVRWVRGAAVAVCLGAVARAAEPPGVDVDWDLLSASDVQLVQGAAAGMVEVGPTSIRAGLSGGWMGFDYRPVEADLFGSARRVEHCRVGGQVSVSRVLGAGWTALADLGGYSGFLNHRSAWAAEWYQQFDPEISQHIPR